MLLDVYNLSSSVSGAAAGMTGQLSNPMDWLLFGANVLLGVATLCVAFNYLFTGIPKCRIRVSVSGPDKTFLKTSHSECLDGNTGSSGTAGGTSSSGTAGGTSSSCMAGGTSRYGTAGGTSSSGTAGGTSSSGTAGGTSSSGTAGGTSSSGTAGGTSSSGTAGGTSSSGA